MHFPPHAVELAPDSSANERVHLARARGEGGKRSALKWCRDACRVIEPRHHAFRDSGVPGSWVGRLVGWSNTCGAIPVPMPLPPKLKM